MIKATKIYIAGHPCPLGFATLNLDATQTSLYGTVDNYHPENSHVIQTLTCKFYKTKVTSGCECPINLTINQYTNQLSKGDFRSIKLESPPIHIGVGYTGDTVFDAPKPDGTMRKLMHLLHMKAFERRAPTGFNFRSIQAQKFPRQVSVIN